ncbi:MAG: flagellar protein FlgN [Lachnospiraceae bacterium]|nr:flagellar protein FlgN [Lachnospiraceae bacterium]
METLISVLDEESAEYDKLLQLSIAKTPVIVSENLSELARITDEEQVQLSRIQNIAKRRDEAIRDIANVLNKDVENMSLKRLIKIMAGRPSEQKALAASYDRLMAAAKQVDMVNARNSELIQSALDMVHFNMNMLQSAKSAPESANYNKGAYSTGAALGVDKQSFDAKQ